MFFVSTGENFRVGGAFDGRPDSQPRLLTLYGSGCIQVVMAYIKRK